MILRRVFNFKLMSVGTTPNGLEVTEEMLFDMLDDRQFDNLPIIFNENEQFKDYRDNNVTEEFNSNHIVGFVSSDARYEDGDILATVFLSEEFANKTKYDNWQIEIDENNNITYCSCELFSADLSEKDKLILEYSSMNDDLKYQNLILEDRIFELEKEIEELKEVVEELRRKKL